MAKATREIKEKIKLVDLVVELLDARAPFSCQHPFLKEINKEKLVILTKRDLCDESKLSYFEKKFKKDGVEVLSLDLTRNVDLKKVFKSIDKVMEKKVEGWQAKGLIKRRFKVLVFGIPNVGKSTFINKVTKRKGAPSANTPGFTKGQKWVKTQNIEMLDTPGVLWPNLDDEQKAINLALIGTIKEHILPKEDLAKKGLEFLVESYPKLLEEKYDYKDGDFFKHLAQKRGFLLKDGDYNIERSIDTFLKEFRDGKIGRITLEGETNG